MVEFNYRNFK